MSDKSLIRCNTANITLNSDNEHDLDLIASSVQLKHDKSERDVGTAASIDPSDSGSYSYSYSFSASTSFGFQSSASSDDDDRKSNIDSETDTETKVSIIHKQSNERLAPPDILQVKPNIDPAPVRIRDGAKQKIPLHDNDTYIIVYGSESFERTLNCVDTVSNDYDKLWFPTWNVDVP
jgi:hypothetical protein